MHMHTYSSYIVMNQQTCMNNQPCGGVISESSKSSPPPCTPLSTSSARAPPLHSFQANSGQLHLHPKSVARRRGTPPTIRRAPAPSSLPGRAESACPLSLATARTATPTSRATARPLAVRTSSALRIGGASSSSAERAGAGDISRHACVSFHKWCHF